MLISDLRKWKCRRNQIIAIEEVHTRKSRLYSQLVSKRSQHDGSYISYQWKRYDEAKRRCISAPRENDNDGLDDGNDGLFLGLGRLTHIWPSNGRTPGVCVARQPVVRLAFLLLSYARKLTMSHAWTRDGWIWWVSRKPRWCQGGRRAWQSLSESMFLESSGAYLICLTRVRGFLDWTGVDWSTGVFSQKSPSTKYPWNRSLSISRYMLW